MQRRAAPDEAAPGAFESILALERELEARRAAAEAEAESVLEEARRAAREFEGGAGARLERALAELRRQVEGERDTRVGEIEQTGTATAAAYERVPEATLRELARWVALRAATAAEDVTEP